MTRFISRRFDIIHLSFMKLFETQSAKVGIIIFSLNQWYYQSCSAQQYYRRCFYPFMVWIVQYLFQEVSKCLKLDTLFLLDTTYDNPENTPFFLVNDDLWTVTELIYEAPAPDVSFIIKHCIFILIILISRPRLLSDPCWPQSRSDISLSINLWEIFAQISISSMANHS